MTAAGAPAGDCPLCGSSEIDESRQVSNLQGEEVEIVRCSECALVRRNVGPDRDRYHADENPVTDSEVWAHAKAADPSLPGFETTWRNRVDFALSELLEGRLERCPRALEIGCGTGHNLAAFCRYGCDVIGVEPPAAAARFGRERFELHIVEAYVEDADLGADLFDLVILDSVFEHLPDPVGTLRSLKPLVALGGRIYLDVPNLEAWHGKLLGKTWNIYEPGHINFFTPETLARTVEAAGFEIVKSTTYDGLVTWGEAIEAAAIQFAKRLEKRGSSRGRVQQSGRNTEQGDVELNSLIQQPIARRRIEIAGSLALGRLLTPLRKAQFRRGGGMDIWVLAKVSNLR